MKNPEIVHPPMKIVGKCKQLEMFKVQRLLPTTLAMSSSMLFSAQAQGREPPV